MSTRTGGVRFELTAGDITDQPDVDAIVNAANAKLEPGGGVAGAIHRAAGPGLAAECRPLAPIQPGSCVVTGAHDLPNRYVIHVLGPVHGVDEPSDVLLADAYRCVLAAADARACTSVATPAVSTGVFGFPMRDAARIALTTVAAAAASLRHVRLVRFVLFTPGDLDVHRDVLGQLADAQ